MSEPSKYVPTDHPDLIRDTHSKAILTYDPSGLEAYRARAAAIKKTSIEISSINKMKDDLSDLRNEMLEIKGLLRGLIDGQKGN